MLQLVEGGLAQTAEVNSTRKRSGWEPARSAGPTGFKRLYASSINRRYLLDLVALYPAQVFPSTRRKRDFDDHITCRVFLFGGGAMMNDGRLPVAPQPKFPGPIFCLVAEPFDAFGAGKSRCGLEPIIWIGPEIVILLFGVNYPGI